MAAITGRRIAVCPHCATEKAATVTTVRPELTLCDSEDGGCDRYFVYHCIEQPRQYAISSSPLNFQPQE